MKGAKHWGISNNSTINYALDNNRNFIKRSSDKKYFM